MELRSCNFVALLLVTASFVDLINSACLVNRHPHSSVFWYQCVGSVDYVSDLKRAPIDVQHVFFSISTIPIIGSAVFSRLEKNLTILEVANSKVKEIEDNAFQGLVELSGLNLAGNELEIVKEAWFKGLPKLTTILLSHNKIRHIEDGFFSAVSPLKQLSIDYNELTSVSKSALYGLNVTKIKFEFNPWSWKSLSDIAGWLEDKKPIAFDRHNTDGWFLAQNVTKNCIAQSPEPQPTDDYINSCVQTKLLQWIPTVQNYTFLQICRMQDNPSPFLWCGRSRRQRQISNL